jgi:uncharacterized protein YndB with AHSA1/START domain
MRLALTLVAALVLAGSASAKIVDSQPDGFEVSETADIAAPAAEVWTALGEIGSWWDAQHTFSGDAKNLSIELKPGGCFCEALPDGGGVAHLQVVYVRPKTAVRLSGALGPLQSTGAGGHMAWTLKETGLRTTFTLTYDVGGYARGGLKAWAKPVDKVLGEQVARLKRYVEKNRD